MKNVAIVGFGFMGRMHYGCWKKTRGARVCAICDRDLAQLKHARAGNIAGAAEETDFGDTRIFADFGELLAAGGIDIVDLTVPTPFHRELACQALAAGVNVLCEKPMALSTKDCDAMLSVAAKSKGKLLVAQCLRFWPEYVYLENLVRSGRYGKVVAADFTRFCATPGWNNGGKSWFLDEKKSGGVIFDMHVHDADVVDWLFGVPNAVTSRAHVRPDGITDHLTTTYDVSSGAVVTSDVSWAGTGTFGFEAGFKVFFEKAVVVFDAKRATPLMVYPTNGKAFAAKVSSESAYAREIKSFLAWVEGRTDQLPLTAKDARNAIHLVETERKSARRGKTIRV